MVSYALANTVLVLEFESPQVEGLIHIRRTPAPSLGDDAITLGTYWERAGRRCRECVPRASPHLPCREAGSPLPPVDTRTPAAAPTAITAQTQTLYECTYSSPGTHVRRSRYKESGSGNVHFTCTLYCDHGLPPSTPTAAAALLLALESRSKYYSPQFYHERVQVAVTDVLSTVGCPKP